MKRTELEQFFEHLLAEPEGATEGQPDFAARAELLAVLMRARMAAGASDATTAKLAVYLAGELDAAEAETFFAELVRAPEQIYELEAAQSFLDRIAKEKSTAPPDLVAAVVAKSATELPRPAVSARRKRNLSGGGRRWVLAGGAMAAMLLVVLAARLSENPIAVSGSAVGTKPGSAEPVEAALPQTAADARGPAIQVYTAPNPPQAITGNAVATDDYPPGFIRQVQLARNGKGLTDEQMLDVLRLRLALGDLKTDSDYLVFAQQALIAGYPSEAKAALDKGIAAKLVQNNERVTRLSKKIDDDLAASVRVQFDLQKKASNDPNASVELGLILWSTGKYKEAEDAIRAGIASGQLADPERAKLALGHVLFSQGKKQDAVAAFDSVARDSKEAPIATLWSIYAAHSRSAVPEPVYTAPNPPQAMNSHAVTAEDYPPDSVRLQEQGAVKLQYFIETDGNVSDCRLIESSGFPRLDDAACVLVRKWQFKPATVLDGSPVAIWMPVTIVFALKNDSVPSPASGASSQSTPPVAVTDHAVTAADYPPISLLEQAKIGIKYTVGADGSVIECAVTMTSGKTRLDDAACTLAKRRWKFKPATQDGRPVAASLSEDVIFALKAASEPAPSTPAYAGRRVILPADNKSLADAVTGAQADFKAGRFAEALAKAKAADAMPGKPPELTRIIHGMIVSYAINAKDYATALAQLEKNIAANEGNKTENLKQALLVANQMQNKAKVAEYAGQLGNNLDPDTRRQIQMLDTGQPR
jgi:TonB family protein